MKLGCGPGDSRNVRTQSRTNCRRTNAQGAGSESEGGLWDKPLHLIWITQDRKPNTKTQPQKDVRPTHTQTDTQDHTLCRWDCPNSPRHTCSCVVPYCGELWRKFNNMRHLEITLKCNTVLCSVLFLKSSLFWSAIMVMCITSANQSFQFKMCARLDQ